MLVVMRCPLNCPFYQCGLPSPNRTFLSLKKKKKQKKHTHTHTHTHTQTNKLHRDLDNSQYSTLVPYFLFVSSQSKEIAK